MRFRTAAALILLLAGCGGLPEERGSPSSLAGQPSYQQRIVPLYPAPHTPRLTVWGDLDTPRDYMGQRWRHAGFDIAGSVGEAVIAVAPGEACVARNEIEGLVVRLMPKLPLGEGEPRDLLFYGPRRAADGTVTEGSHRLRIGYAHLSGSPIATDKCRSVALGETVGFIGTSGIASRPHLHFEIVVETPGALPGERKLNGAINPLLLMRREPGQPLGTIACHEPGMTYRANAGDPPDALTIVWPTARC